MPCHGCWGSAGRTLASWTLVIVIAAMTTTLLAQAPVPDAQAVAMAAGTAMPPKEKLGGARQFQLTRIYAMEIRRVEAAASLESAQKTKLTIGAKGLAKKKSQKFVRDMIARGLEETGGGPAPAAQPKSDEPDIQFVEVKSFDDIDADTKRRLDCAESTEAQPYDDPEWLKLVKSVLKPEQFTKYQQVIAANKLRTDQAFVMDGVARLRQELALSPDQESQLTSLIEEHMSKAKPAAGHRDSNGLAEDMARQMEANPLVLVLMKIDSSILQSILTPPQFEQVNVKLDIIKSVAGEIKLDGAPAAPSAAE